MIHILIRPRRTGAEPFRICGATDGETIEGARLLSLPSDALLAWGQICPDCVRRRREPRLLSMDPVLRAKGDNRRDEQPPPREDRRDIARRRLFEDLWRSRRSP